VEYNFCEELRNPRPPSKADLLANGAPPGSASAARMDFGQVASNPDLHNINSRREPLSAIWSPAPDVGGGPHVRVFDFLTGREVFRFLAYEAGFTGGVRVATGDVNGDGISDIITAPGFGGGPVIRIWDGATANCFRSSWPTMPIPRRRLPRSRRRQRRRPLRGHHRRRRRRGPHVKVFSSQRHQGSRSPSPQTSSSWPTFELPRRRPRGAADFKTATALPTLSLGRAGGGPHVKVFDLTQAFAGGFGLITQFMAFDPSFRGGIFVRGRHQDRGRRHRRRPARISSSAWAPAANQVRVFSGVDFQIFFQFDGFAAKHAACASQ